MTTHSSTARIRKITAWTSITSTYLPTLQNGKQYTLPNAQDLATDSHSGHELNIKAKGNFTKKVEKGAYVSLQVKYGLIRLVSTTADLCEQMGSIDEECPLEGDKTITKKVALPAQVPPVRHAVSVSIHLLTLLRARITFWRMSTPRTMSKLRVWKRPSRSVVKTATMEV